MIVEAAFLLKGGYLGVLSRWCFLLNVGGGELLCMHTPHPHPHPLFADAIGTTGFCQHAALKVQIWIEKFHGKVCGGWHLVGGGGGGGGGFESVFPIQNFIMEGVSTKKLTHCHHQHRMNVKLYL